MRTSLDKAICCAGCYLFDSSCSSCLDWWNASLEAFIRCLLSPATFFPPCFYWQMIQITDYANTSQLSGTVKRGVAWKLQQVSQLPGTMTWKTHSQIWKKSRLSILFVETGPCTYVNVQRYTIGKTHVHNHSFTIKDVPFDCLQWRIICIKH